MCSHHMWKSHSLISKSLWVFECCCFPPWGWEQGAVKRTLSY